MKSEIKTDQNIKYIAIIKTEANNYRFNIILAFGVV